MKKCCLVNFHGDWGGAEKVALETMKVLKKSYDVTLVTGFHGEFTNRIITDDGIKLRVLLKIKPSFEGLIKKLMYILKFGWHLRNYVRNEELELVYLNNQVAIVSSIFLLGLNCKVIAHDHTYQRNNFKKFFYNMIIFVCIDRLIYVSRDLERSNIMFGLKKSRVVYNGFEFNADNMRHRIENRTVVMPSMFRSWKGHVVLIHALAQVSDEGIDYNCEILGSANSVSERRYMKMCVDLVCKYDLTDKVKFVGFVDDVLPYLNRDGYILVQPSNLADPLPTTLIEACFLGIPMIGTKIGGIPEIITEGKNGFTFECNNSQDLAQQLKRLLLQSDTLRTEMENHAKRTFSEKFTVQKFQQNIAKVIKSC